jgi:hypothetical protein
MRPGSRRDVFNPHASDVLRLHRCPVCQAALEQDHVEALAMNAQRPSSGAATTRMPAVRRVAVPGATGFALI